MTDLQEKEKEMINVSDSDPEEKTISDVEEKDEKEDKKTANKLLQLPVSRIKTIMKSSPELGNVSQESYFAITKATELFVKYLAKEAHKSSGKSKFLEYKALSKLVSTDESLDFLEEIVPFKIKMSEYWAKYGRPVDTDKEDNVPLKSSSLKSPASSGKSVNKVQGNSTASSTPEVICID